jgi:hypothetical protein
MWATLLKMLTTLPKNIDEKMFGSFLKTVDEKILTIVKKIISKK